MTNLDRIRRMSAEEMADALDRWIVRCSGYCPALAECRNGMSCRQALITWLTREEDNEQSKRD